MEPYLINRIHVNRFEDYIGKMVFVSGNEGGSIRRVLGVLQDGTMVFDDWSSVSADDVRHYSTRLYLLDDILNYKPAETD